MSENLMKDIFSKACPGCQGSLIPTPAKAEATYRPGHILVCLICEKVVKLNEHMSPVPLTLEEYVALVLDEEHWDRVLTTKRVVSEFQSFKKHLRPRGPSGGLFTQLFLGK